MRGFHIEAGRNVRCRSTIGCRSTKSRAVALVQTSRHSGRSRSRVSLPMRSLPSVSGWSCAPGGAGRRRRGYGGPARVRGWITQPQVEEYPQVVESVGTPPNLRRRKEPVSSKCVHDGEPNKSALIRLSVSSSRIAKAFVLRFESSLPLWLLARGNRENPKFPMAGCPPAKKNARAFRI